MFGAITLSKIHSNPATLLPQCIIRVYIAKPPNCAMLLSFSHREGSCLASWKVAPVRIYLSYVKGLRRLRRGESGLVHYTVEIKALPWKESNTRMVNKATWRAVPRGWRLNFFDVGKLYKLRCTHITDYYVIISMSRKNDHE